MDQICNFPHFILLRKESRNAITIHGENEKGLLKTLSHVKPAETKI